MHVLYQYESAFKPPEINFPSLTLLMRVLIHRFVFRLIIEPGVIHHRVINQYSWSDYIPTNRHFIKRHLHLTTRSEMYVSARPPNDK